MKKYIITILDLRTGTNDKIVSNEQDIKKVFDLYLGGVDNTNFTTTPTFDCIGILKNTAKSFSILCYTPNN